MRHAKAAADHLRLRCPAAAARSGRAHRPATAAAHPARLDTQPWRCGRQFADGARGECQCRRPRRAAPRGLLQRHPDLPMVGGRALSGLHLAGADHRYRARARRRPDRRRPDRCRRHRALDHRRHRERIGDHASRPRAGEADAARHHDQPRYHHGSPHLHARAARRRQPVHAGRGLGLSAAARFAASAHAGDAGHSRHRGAQLPLCPERRQSAVAADCRLRRRTAGLCRVPARHRPGRDAPLFVIGSEGELQIVNSRIYRNILIVDRLFGAAELRLGSGDHQQTVRISRSDGRPSS